MKYNLDTLFELTREKWLKHQTYKDQLHIFCYSNRTEWKKNWTDLTRDTRGIVLDREGNLVGKCIPKFFHVNEHESTKLANLPTDSPCEIFQKLDGSCILLFFNPFEESWQYSSKCSFTSDFVKAAERTLPIHLVNRLGLPENLTFVFELRFSGDPMRRVVDLKNGLYLLAVYEGDLEMKSSVVSLYAETLPGVRLPSREVGDFFSYYNTFNSLEGTEGFVVKFADGSRVKLKTPWYVVRNKFLDEITGNKAEEFVKEMLINFREYGDYLQAVPEDYHQEVKAIEKRITDKLYACKDRVDLACAAVEGLGRKDIALALAGEDPLVRAATFLKLDGADYEEYLWRKL